MQKYLFCLFFLLLGFTNATFSQIKVSFGLEAGANYSGIPNKYNISTQLSKNKLFTQQSNAPLFRPMLGIWGKAVWSNHFSTHLGFQYVKVGNHYNFHQETSDSTQNVVTIEDNNTIQSFQRLSFPMTINYDFFIKKLKMNLFLGYKINYFLRGDYYQRHLLVNSNNLNNEMWERNRNPFDKEDFSTPAKRFRSGAFVGAGMYFNTRFSLTLNYGFNQSLSFGTKTITNEVYNIYGNQDIFFILRYRIL
jgi:hypothetical protein